MVTGYEIGKKNLKEDKGDGTQHRWGDGKNNYRQCMLFKILKSCTKIKSNQKINISFDLIVYVVVKFLSQVIFIFPLSQLH